MAGRVGGSPHRQLGEGGQADDHRSRRPQSRDDRVIGNLRFGTGRTRSLAHRQSGHGNDVLDRDGHSCQRKRGQIRPVREGEGVGSGLFGEDRDERLNLRFTLVDGRERGLDMLHRARDARANLLGDDDG